MGSYIPGFGMDSDACKSNFYKIQSENGECPKSDHAKTLVLISIYSVFRGLVDHGGGVSIYTYIYIYIYIYIDILPA